MTKLFTQTIENWNDWGNIFQNIPAFTPIINAINKKHNLPDRSVSHLLPGTNAVFRAGNIVYKIYAPKESGLDTTADFVREIASIKNAGTAGVHTPEIICTGEIADRYLFRYMVQSYIDGNPAASILPSYLNIEKQAFASKLRQIVQAMSKIEPQTFIGNLMINVRENERWRVFPPQIHKQVIERAEQIDLTDSHYVHGDLTGENVIIGKDGEIYLIDFADCQTAPYYYDWCPLFFELFGCDRTLAGEYFKDQSGEGFIYAFLNALILHDFGGDFAKKLCAITSTKPESITSITDFIPLLRKVL